MRKARLKKPGIRAIGPGKKKKKKGTTMVTSVERVPGEVVQKREDRGASIEFERGKETRTYTPVEERTGHSAYGRESKTKDSPEFIKRARAAKVDVVTKDGLQYRAGVTTVTKEPDKIKTTVDVTPEIRKFDTLVRTDFIKNPSDKVSTAKLKGSPPRSMTFGGSDKNDVPYTKYGVARKKGFRQKRKVTYRKNRNF